MKTKEKEINGIKFTVTPFHVSAAIKLKAYLIRTLGPSIGQMVGALQGGIPTSGKMADFGNIKVDGAALSSAIEKLTEQLGENEFLALIKRMLENVQAQMVVEGETKVFTFGSDAMFENAMDFVFEGRIFTIYPVLALVMETNYPDFLGMLTTGIGQQIKKIVTTASEKPGQTGDSASSGT